MNTFRGKKHCLNTARPLASALRGPPLRESQPSLRQNENGQDACNLQQQSGWQEEWKEEVGPSWATAVVLMSGRKLPHNVPGSCSAKMRDKL